MPTKRLFTGLQPSGALHIGNYFGALKPFLDIYTEYDSMLMVADYHALTSLKDAAMLKENIIAIVKDYLAIGVDPTKAILFRQSDNPDHTELGWIFDCLVSVPFLELGHAYKDKVAKGLEANAGLFTYPMLMAADILLYDTDVVPVGEDQRQHIEYAREAATKFNNTFYEQQMPSIKGMLNAFSKTGGNTFRLPKELILTGVGIVPGTDGKKMSKSYKNTIPLFGTKDEITRAVMSIVTDSSGERPANVYEIHKLFRDEATLEALYEEKKGKYKVLKEALIEDIEGFVAPMRAKRENISDEDVRAVLQGGAARARERSNAKMKEVRAAVGLTI